MNFFQGSEIKAKFFLFFFFALFVGCDKGGDSANLKQTGLTGQGATTFEGFYALTDFVVTSQSNPSVVNDQGKKALSVFLTAKADGTVSIVVQSPHCDQDPSTHTCLTPVVNNPQNMTGTWEKQGNQFLVKVITPENNQTLSLTFDMTQDQNGVIASGSQTGGPMDMNMDQAGLHDGKITKIVLQKYMTDPTAADLFGDYEIVQPNSNSYSNIDSQTKPLIDAGITSAQLKLDGSGNFQVTETPAPSTPPPSGTYEFVDRNHLTVHSSGKTMKFVYRYLKESKRLTLWNFNDTNSFGTGPGPSPEVSSTVQVDLTRK